MLFGAILLISAASAARIDILRELGVPPERMNDRIMILSNDAHNDWDWLYGHDHYLHNGTCVPNWDNQYSCRQTSDWIPVKLIIKDAFQLIAKNRNKSKPFFYSICEMSYLKETLAIYPELLASFATEVGDKLRIVGGGMASPDSLLPHGEAIVRNYLTGQLWQQTTLRQPLRQAYLPDDFGLDDQLPVVFDAMGFQGVTFGRIPANLKNGVSDFRWLSNDGSKIVAHWLVASEPSPPNPGYNLGYYMFNSETISNIEGYLEDVHNDHDGTNGSSVYIPVGGDFAWPYHNLLDAAEEWNAYAVEKKLKVYAAVGTLDHYIQLTSELPGLLEKKYNPTPYWTGFYVSRPILKNLHFEATNLLLAAEAAEATAFVAGCPSPSLSEKIDAIWEFMVPSTHHDFITGTAVDDVYAKEQLPRSQLARDSASKAQDATLTNLAGCVGRSIGKVDPSEQAVLIFNPHGFLAKQVLVEVPLAADQAGKYSSVRFEDGTRAPIQYDSKKKSVIFQANLASLTYTTAFLNPQSATSKDSVSAKATKTGVIFENGALTAEIGGDGCEFGISRLVDKVDAGKNVLGACSNAFRFHSDDGHIYQFAHESSGYFPYDDHYFLKRVNATQTESGPVRVSYQLTFDFTSRACGSRNHTARYVVEYSLIAGEKFLRIAANGRAPLDPQSSPAQSCGYTVLSSFTFADAKSTEMSVSHGTAYHWTDFQPEVNADYDTVFRSTHDFLLGVRQGSSNSFAGAIYHDSMNGWALDPSRNLLGAMFRNSPRDGVGAKGSDGIPTTQYFAVRIPSGLTSPAQNSNLVQESRLFRNPLQGRVIPTTSDASVSAVPITLTVASSSDPRVIISTLKLSSFARVTDSAAKPDLVLRLYQGTNSPVKAEINVAGSWNARETTALEMPVPAHSQRINHNPPVDVAVSSSTSTFGVELPQALSTFMLSPK